MTVRGDSSGPTAERLVAGLRRAALIGSVLMLLSAGSWLAIRFGGTAPPEPGDNPMRPWFESVWPSIVEGQAVRDVIKRMGPPDEQHERSERISDCSGPCDVPCDRSHICVREYQWESAPKGESSETYSACMDESGIVRRKSTGLRFELNSGGHSYGFGDLVVWTILALIGALPIAGWWIFERGRPWEDGSSGMSRREAKDELR